MYADWLKDGLAKKGKTGRALAKLLGRSESSISRMANGLSTIKAIELPIIAAYIGEPIPQGADKMPLIYADIEPTLGQAKVVGKVSLSGWSEDIGHESQDIVPAIPAPQYSHLKQSALWLETRIGDYQQGTYIVFVEFSEARAKPLAGDKIIVKHQEGRLHQYRILHAERGPGGVYLIDAASGKQFELAEGDIITGLAIGAYTSF